MHSMQTCTPLTRAHTQAHWLFASVFPATALPRCRGELPMWVPALTLAGAMHRPLVQRRNVRHPWASYLWLCADRVRVGSNLRPVSVSTD